MNVETMTREEMQAAIIAMQAQNAKLKAAQNRPIKLKVSEKGALSVYGLGRFPVTLYKSQWPKLLDHAEAIRDFLRDNDSLLASKE